MFSLFVFVLSFVLFNFEKIEACTESITVESIELETGNPYLTCDLSRFVGTYWFYGFDDITGFPRYVQASTNGEFSLGYHYSNSVGNYLALKFTGTNIDVIDNDLSDGDASLFSSSFTWYSSHDYLVTEEESYLYYIDNSFFNYETEDDYDVFYANYYPIRLKISEDLCDSHGLVYSPDEADEREQCPNYDYTVYSSCIDDPYCTNCQNWGCAQCETGYYKMGNLMRCQSCNENYPNCQTCGDWNGCTSCNSGYLLQWSADCNDDTCQ